MQRLRPGRPGLALLAAAVALMPPLVTPAGRAPAPAVPPAPPAATAAPVMPATLLAALARALPPADRLHHAALSADGALTVAVDTPDPAALRARLSGNAALAGLATVGEAIVPDAGRRVSLARPGRPLPAMAPADATAIVAGAGLLVEPGAAGLAVSGAEPAVLALVARLDRAGITLAPWRIEATGDGAVRLSGRPVRRAGPPAAGPPRRPLFPADAAPAAPPADAPVLLGIAGRLGRDAVALVRDGDGGVATLPPGGTIGGWRLDNLSADAALFTRNGERARVAMPAADAPETPATP